MKANKYIQPVVDVITIESAYTICAESKFGPFTEGGGTSEHDPITEGL